MVTRMIHKGESRISISIPNNPVSHFIMSSSFAMISLMSILHILELHAATTWWRHQMETFSALLALCAGNSPINGEFPSQRSVTRSFAVFFDLRLNKWSTKQSICRWFVTPSHSLCRPCNDVYRFCLLADIRSIIWRTGYTWTVQMSLRLFQMPWPSYLYNGDLYT